MYFIIGIMASVATRSEVFKAANYYESMNENLDWNEKEIKESLYDPQQGLIEALRQRQYEETVSTDLFSWWDSCVVQVLSALDPQDPEEFRHH